VQGLGLNCAGDGADSKIDNVLLEWVLTVELQSLGRLSSCLPILLGAYDPNAADGRHISECTPSLYPACLRCVCQ
jgi:hypothetical protein